MYRRLHLVVSLLALPWLASTLTPTSRAAAETLSFEVTLPADPAAGVQTFLGRIYLLLTKNPATEPRLGPNWFAPEPFFGLDVANFARGTSRTIDDQADGFPDRLSKLSPGRYRVQAVLDHDFYHQHHARGAGNFYSAVSTWDLDPALPKNYQLVLDQLISEPKFPENAWLREVVVRSELLTKFHRHDVVEKAAVVLPASYATQPERRYPVIYFVPGFGGSHRDAIPRFGQAAPTAGPEEVDFIRVFLSGDCKWGHHVYADSVTNGPRGESLVRELIPHIDATFRTVPTATARFITGHSSGGWSSIWLQVSYPDVFGGAWSSSPDPVDFRDYQQVNLYADPPQSLYVDEQGQRRPIARRGGQPVLWYDSFGKMDDVLGRGGQLRSFEAVFSPLGPDGLPRKLWDRTTGRIDPEVARAWQAYDIRLKLERNWPTLGPKLAGKLHVVMGSLDTFYLEGAVEKLAETLKRLGSDAEIEILPGKDHGGVLTPDYFSRARKQISAAFLKHHQ